MFTARITRKVGERIEKDRYDFHNLETLLTPIIIEPKNQILEIHITREVK